MPSLKKTALGIEIFDYDLCRHRYYRFDHTVSSRVLDRIKMEIIPIYFVTAQAYSPEG